MVLKNRELENRFQKSLEAFQEAATFNKRDARNRLLSQVDILCHSKGGIDFLYKKMPDLVNAGIFQETVWDSPGHLVSGLVTGTLLSGYPNSTLEVLSELRLLNVMEGRITYANYTPDQAHEFVGTVIVGAFDLAFEDFTKPVWRTYSKRELRKIRFLFDFLLKKIPLESLKDKISQEVDVLSKQRPIVTQKLERILEVISTELKFNDQDLSDQNILRFISALLFPTQETRKAKSTERYQKTLDAAGARRLRIEATTMAGRMHDTGLVSVYHVTLLRHLAREAPDLIPLSLHLNKHGEAEFTRHQELVLELIEKFIIEANKQAVFGLARVLQRNLLSRRTTHNALSRLMEIKVHPEVADRLRQGNMSGKRITPLQQLIGGAISVLGQPLGVRQGNNPTCQSARGLSMWSRHAPGKLINMLIDAAGANNLVFRYEGQLIESQGVLEGLTQKFDYKLDPVSIVLVPHMDKIYNEMMKRASIKHLGKDPHVSVNPAFYGHWIQTGFLSVYDPLTNSIKEYNKFVRTFYGAFHPEYNGGHHLIYPVPVGIFITDAAANMLGYHAISLTRVEQTGEGEWRAYFFNPNSEGEQNWGQGIIPTIADNGEYPGESSLPVYEFVSRVYAYHYNHLRLQMQDKPIPETTVAQVRKLATESWGRKYNWSLLQV